MVSQMLRVRVSCELEVFITENGLCRDFDRARRNMERNGTQR